MVNCPGCGQGMTQGYVDENVQGTGQTEITHPRTILAPWYTCNNLNCKVVKAHFEYGAWMQIERVPSKR